VHDSISVEQLGIPSACVITDGFLPTARVMAEFAGIADYPLVVIDHPISDNTPDQLRAKAEQIVQQAVALLGGRAIDAPAGGPGRRSAPWEADGLETIRELLRADSADVQLLGFEDGVARLRLVLGLDCEECVMPRSFLEPMLLRHIQQTRPDIQRVILEDPREAG
jgi:hypothetical protein